MLIYCSRKDVNHKLESKDLYKVESLLNNYKKIKSDGLIGENDERFLQGLVEKAKIYQEFINYEQLDQPIDNSEISKMNIVALGFPVTAIVPYLLYIITEVEDSERERMLSLLTNYFIRRMGTRSPTNNYGGEGGFSGFIKEGINTYEKMRDKMKELVNTTNHFPSDEFFLKHFSVAHLINPHAKVILFLLENSLRSDKDQNQTKSLHGYQLEHIMPKKWTDHWQLNDETPENIAERDSSLRTVGNLTLLTGRLNGNLKNKSWHDKKHGVGGKGGGLLEHARGVKIFGEEFLGKEEWNEATIKERSEFLAKEIIKQWPYPF